jgi:Tfp pilus assembly protein PilX
MNALRLIHARRFLRDTRGSILPVFVVMMFVVIAMIGMGVDYTRASLANAKMQAALDATALAMSRLAAALPRPCVSRGRLVVHSVATAISAATTEAPNGQAAGGAGFLRGYSRPER